MGLFGKHKNVEQKSRDELHAYWRKPDELNNPDGYVKPTERSEFLLSIVGQYVPDKNASILELGCNVGRNLSYLWNAGYHNLSGVEINADAIAKMWEHYFDMHVQTHQGSIEEHIKQLPNYDLIFTMAVLEHIHKDSEWVFEEMAKRAKTLITIEDEKHVSVRHFPRNYRRIFEGLGMKQIYEKQLSKEGEGLGPSFYARIFAHP